MASLASPEEASASTATACRRENSAGRVPVVLTLAASDLASGTGQPPPFYVMAPRLACLPSLVGQATRFYRDYLTEGEDTPWFDSGGVPLRSHVPLATLHDMAALPSSHPHPWPLTIHFRAFPADALIRWPGPDPGRSSFFNALKEAACAATGSAAGILSAPVPDRDAVWAAAEQGDADGAWSATSRMLVVGGERETTLGEALLDALPTPPPGDGEAAAAWSLAWAGEGTTTRLALGGTPVAAVLASSVPAPLSSPAAWAHAALAAPDRFLYVVVCVSRSPL